MNQAGNTGDCWRCIDPVFYTAGYALARRVDRFFESDSLRLGFYLVAMMAKLQNLDLWGTLSAFSAMGSLLPAAWAKKMSLAAFPCIARIVTLLGRFTDAVYGESLLNTFGTL